jgi:hypothetical protein
LFSFDISRELKLEGFNENPLVWEEPFYKIVGEINPNYKLKINQELIDIENNGSFSKTVELKPGFNTIIFKVKSLLKEEKEILKEIYYKTENIENLNTTTTIEDNFITTSTINN